MYRRVHEPEALDPRSAIWRGGRFDAGRRPFTPLVEGVTRTADHLLLVTLLGGARRLSVTAGDGHRYEGPDRAGAVSFVPANCERRLRLEDVEAEWASIALAPTAFDVEDAAQDFAPFSNVEDPFVAAVIGEIDRAHRQDGAVEPAYGEAMSLALARHLARLRRKVGTRGPRRSGMQPWKLRRVEEFVEANLDRPLAIADLAETAGLSAGRFHRAFRDATGMTPLGYLTERRVDRAVALLKDGELSVLEVAARLGFESPSHFARVFRQATGRRPSEARNR